jgi:hypothetical protein
MTACVSYNANEVDGSLDLHALFLHLSSTT